LPFGSCAPTGRQVKLLAPGKVYRFGFAAGATAW
jgi:hypothetical protein